MKKLIILIVALVVTAPTAAAADYRSPDRRDAGAGMADLRSPDTREAAQQQQLGSRLDGVEALRSKRGIVAETVFVSASRFDWSDAAIGAAAMLGFFLVVGGLLIVASRGLATPEALRGGR